MSVRKYAQNDQNQDFGCVRGLKRVKKGPKWGSSQKKYFFQEKIPKHYLKTYKSILGLEKSFGRTYGRTDGHFEDIAQLEVENFEGPDLLTFSNHSLTMVEEFF